MADTKTKQQKTAERAEILESMAEEEKALYRKRKDYVSVNHDWKEFFKTMKGDDLKELIIAIIDYDKTGEIPKLKNPANSAVFMGFMKNFLDKRFGEWCYTCYMASSKGGKGGKAKAINFKILERCVQKYHAPEFDGVPFTELIKDNTESWNKLEGNGHTELEITNLKKDIAEFRKQCESEYQGE